MAINSFFKRNWTHFAAIGIFLLIGFIYFSKQMQGYGLKQHDVEQFIGSAHETTHYRETHNGAEPLWTNSMFGGMPTIQISTAYPGNWFFYVTNNFLKLFSAPMGIVLLYMLCFYMAMVMMKVNRWAAVIGAVAFAFFTYDIILLQAGHNSKGVALAYILPVIGAFYMTYRRNWIWGAILSAVFMGFEMSANHLQITYYSGILLLGMGLVEVVRAVKGKTYMNFIKASAGIVVAYILAAIVNYGNITLTADYSKYTIRGGNDITLNADGTSNAARSTEGLDRDYVTQYSYGIGESFNILSPYIKGGATGLISDSQFAEKVENSDLNSEQMEMVMGSNAYWGDQPFVSGPVYMSVILVFFAFLGLIYIKDPIKWALLGGAILAMMLAWGKNYMGLTNWFLDNIPGYDKFRAVTIIMVVVEVCMAMLAVLFLDRLIKDRETIKQNLKPLYIGMGAFMVLLIVLRVGGLGDGYLSAQESDPNMRAQQEMAIRNQINSMDPAQLAQNGIDKNNPQQINQVISQQMERFDNRIVSLKTIRKEIYNSSMNRSIGFTFVAIIALLLLFHTSMPSMAVVGGIGGLIVIDLLLVTSNYLNNEEQGTGYKYWETKLNTLYPVSAEEGDKTILEMETAANPKLNKEVEAGRREGKRLATELGAVGVEERRIEDAYAFAELNAHTNYRVFDFSGGFNSARASYFHKSLGGYHGAKLRSMQNLFEFHLAKSNNKVYDMLNVKYFLQPGGEGQDAPLAARPNPTAMGNAWLVRNVKMVNDANNELLALGSEFSIANAGTGKLIVNGEAKEKAMVYGSEKLQYFIPGKDTIALGLSNGVPKGLKVFVVQDVRGTVSTVPAQTLDLDTAKSFTKLAAYEVTDEFDVRNQAIVRKDMASKLSQKTYNGEGKVRMTSYAPNRLTYSVDASDKALAVFSEIYYPEGWTATIDGKPVDILRVNYVLRGLEVPKGTHKVVFTFDLPKYHKVNTISALTSMLILLLLAGYGILTWRKKRTQNAEVKA